MSRDSILQRLLEHGRTARTAFAVIIVGGGLLALWQAGILFSDPNESVERTGETGETVAIDIRAADASIVTPGSDVLATGLEPGDLAPDFELSTIDGERVRLSDYRGQAVYLNFWASWCTPCRAEMPDIQALLGQLGDDGFVVLAVNAGEAYGPAIGFVEELELQLTAIGLDPTRAILEAYRVRSMPTSVFIDRDGAITRVHPGFATAAQMQQFALEALESVTAAP